MMETLPAEANSLPRVCLPNPSNSDVFNEWALSSRTIFSSVYGLLSRNKYLNTQSDGLYEVEPEKKLSKASEKSQLESSRAKPIEKMYVNTLYEHFPGKRFP